MEDQAVSALQQKVDVIAKLMTHYDSTNQHIQFTSAIHIIVSIVFVWYILNVLWKTQNLLLRYSSAINMISREIRQRFGPYALDPSYAKKQLKWFSDRMYLVPSDHPLLPYISPSTDTVCIDNNNNNSMLSGTVDIEGKQWHWCTKDEVEAAVEKMNQAEPTIPPPPSDVELFVYNKDHDAWVYDCMPLFTAPLRRSNILWELKNSWV